MKIATSIHLWQRNKGEAPIFLFLDEFPEHNINVPTSYKLQTLKNEITQEREKSDLRYFEITENKRQIVKDFLEKAAALLNEGTAPKEANQALKKMGSHYEEIGLSLPLGPNDKVGTLIELKITSAGNLRGGSAHEYDRIFLIKTGQVWKVHRAYYNRIEQYRNRGSLVGEVDLQRNKIGIKGFEEMMELFPFLQ